jgi:hypothetical protein
MLTSRPIRSRRNTPTVARWVGNGRSPSRGSERRISSPRGLSGTTCSRFDFIRPFGMVQVLAAKSNSDHVAPSTSPILLAFKNGELQRPRDHALAAAQVGHEARDLLPRH